MAILLRLMSLAIAALFWIVAGGLTLFLLMLGMGLLSVLIAPLFYFVGPVGALLMLIMLGITVRRVRERRGTLVLSQLEQTVRLNLPLPAMLHAAEASETGKARRRFARLREAIESGHTIGEAVDAHVPELSPRAVSLIAAGDRLGQLPAVLYRLVRESRTDHRDQDPEQAFAWAYALVLLMSVGLIFAGVGIFIVPAFHEIFGDFDATMPWLTEVTFTFAQRGWWPGMLFAGVVLVGLAAAGRATWQIVHTPDRRPMPWATLTDHLLWCVPGVRRAVGDRALADAFAFIADALRAGQPLDVALAQASELRINAVVRRRLRRCADALQAGADLGDAARRARLPALAYGILGPAQAGDNVIRSFTFLARYYRWRFSRLLAFARATVMPIVVLVAALAVGWLVLALFLPLIALMTTVTDAALSGGRL